VSNSLSISLLLSSFVITKYFHGNMGTYRIGELPWHNTLGFFCWWRSLKILYINSLCLPVRDVTFCCRTCSLSPKTIHVRFRAATAVVDAASNSPPLLLNSIFPFLLIVPICSPLPAFSEGKASGRDCVICFSQRDCKNLDRDHVPKGDDEESFGIFIPWADDDDWGATTGSSREAESVQKVLP